MKGPALFQTVSKDGFLDGSVKQTIWHVRLGASLYTHQREPCAMKCKVSILEWIGSVYEKERATA